MPQSNNVNLDHAQKLLAQLKSNYLAELPARCDELENLVLEFGRHGDVATFDELYRNIHSTKGSAGTHGLPVISTICHDFEDHLNSLEGDFSSIDRRFVDGALKYVDFIRSAVSIAEEEDDYSGLEAELQQHRKSLLKQKKACLLVCPAGYIRMLCQQVLSELPVQVTVVDDGFNALGRLLQQKFDLVITNKEMSQLNGTALTYAVRASDSVNRDVKIVMLTSKHRMEFKGPFGPDYVLQKNVELGQKLLESVQQALKN